MDVVKAVCKCRNFSEDDLVIGVRQAPLETWGCGTWMGAMLLLILSGGTLLPFMIGYIIARNYFHPDYRCQFCNAKIEPKQFRA